MIDSCIFYSLSYGCLLFSRAVLYLTSLPSKKSFIYIYITIPRVPSLIESVFSHACTQESG